MDTIEFIKELALERIKLAMVKAEVKDLQTALEQSQEYQDLQARKTALNVLDAHVKGLEGGIKDRVETAFRLSADKNTKPHEGVQVKKFQVVRILDERAAKEWAGENAPGALSIKTSQFNKIAKALDALDFLEIDTEWRAQIATDLSMYEGDENE